MSTQRQADSGLSVLSLRFEVPEDGRPDWPVVAIRVNDQDPFATVAKDWKGFDPGDVLGPDSPLLPSDTGDKRIAVYRCSCGESGCGVIAPIVGTSLDRSRITWTDFRDFTGVFAGPLPDDEERFEQYEGKRWRLPDFTFDYDQYVTEVQRATVDMSWETPRRQVARRVRERLHAIGAVLPPNLALRSTWPTFGTDEFSVDLVFFHSTRIPERSAARQMLRIRSTEADPESAAADIVERLLSDRPDDWARLHGFSYF